MNWHTLSNQPISNIEQLIEVILSNRDIADLQAFLEPTPVEEITPSQLDIDSAQLEKAVEMINQAKTNQKQVLIFGDYDADGICASSILWLTLHKKGVKAKPFIPDRAKHGYGVTKEALEEIFAKDKPDLVITVDNGIVAHEPLAWLKEQGVQVVVTDHHQPSKQPVQADAIVHSTQVCGAAVAWMLARELDSRATQEHLDLVTIATIADQMQLTGVNRSLVKEGLAALASSSKPGVKALFQVAQVEPSKASVGTVGFMLAPRINAAGRIAHGLTAVRMLCTQNSEAAVVIARELDKLNQQRQDLTQDQMQEAEQQAAAFANHNLIFVHSPEFHEGIIGLLAGRLTEKYAKPSIVVSSEGKVAKASARSVRGVNITQLIRQVEEMLLSVGGHELAAGFSAKSEQLEEIKASLLQIADQEIDAKQLVPQLTIDAELSEELLSFATVESLEQLKPFGLGNSEPVFTLKEINLRDFRQIGANKDHLKLLLDLSGDGLSKLEAVGWRMGSRHEEIHDSMMLDLAFCLEMNSWNGKRALQLRLKDFRSSVK